jgi:hypothetical protein
MSKRVLEMIEIREVLYQYHQGQTIKALKRSFGLARNTIRAILVEAEAVGFSRSLSKEDLEIILEKMILEKVKVPTQTPVQDSIHVYHAQIERWLSEPYMTGKQVHRLLKESYQVCFSDRSLYRYLEEHFEGYGSNKEKKRTTLRIPTTPGHQAQVDFGDVGKLYDPFRRQQRRAYAFVMTLSHSRYRFVRFVFDQTVETWIDCHRRAFEFFGGVPKTIVIDNLKAGVIKADVYDPIINRAYADCERHYSFVVDPALVRTPRHKGKVERSIFLPRQQVLAGRIFAHIEEANEYALQWCRHQISQEVTRTTGRKPFDLFMAEEKAALIPLPAEPFCCPIWTKALVHRDCHIVFQGSFYSVPNTYVGQTVFVRADSALVQIYDESTNAVIKRHPRFKEKGQWRTDLEDYPPKAADFIQRNSTTYIEQAQNIGPHTKRFIQDLVTADTWRQRRKAAGVLGLAEKFSPKDLEEACQLMNKTHQTDHKTLKLLLENHQKIISQARKGAPQSLCSFVHSRFLRDPSEFKAFSKVVWTLLTATKELLPL